jgi:hypothetical protein
MTSSAGNSVPLFVPTRPTCHGDAIVVQLGHLPSGLRVGIAFTSLALLRAATGPRQDWIRLYDDVLRATLAPLGISVIQVDPVLVGPDVRPVEPIGHGPAGATALPSSGHWARRTRSMS